MNSRHMRDADALAVRIQEDLNWQRLAVTVNLPELPPGTQTRLQQAAWFDPVWNKAVSVVRLIAVVPVREDANSIHSSIHSVFLGTVANLEEAIETDPGTLLHVIYARIRHLIRSDQR